MAIVKVIEVLAESKDGWEAATKDAVIEAGKTVKNIRSVYVENMQAVVEGDKIVSYRVNAKISFVVDAQLLSTSNIIMKTNKKALKNYQIFSAFYVGEKCYPDQLKGEEIPMCARIASVSNVYQNDLTRSLGGLRMLLRR